jgi:hypothetical protein
VTTATSNTRTMAKPKVNRLPTVILKKNFIVAFLNVGIGMVAW